jgi:hypothetical protein
MSSLKLNKLGFLIAGASLLAIVVAQGCSNSDDTQAAPTAGSPGTAGKAGNGEGGSGDTGNGEGGAGNTGNTGNTEGGASEAGSGGEGGEAGAAPTCTDATGCYLCAPTNSTQFENGCVTGGCPDTFTDVLSKKALVGTL